MKRIAVALLLAAALPLAAADRDFNDFAYQVEDYFQAPRVRIPLLGLVSLITKFSGPAGVKDFHLAQWKGVTSVRDATKPFPGLGATWQPSVSVDRPKFGEWTRVYTRPEGDWVRLMVLHVRDKEASLVAMTIRPSQVAEILDGLKEDRPTSRASNPTAIAAVR
jgi:hypothetical protein